MMPFRFLPLSLFALALLSMGCAPNRSTGDDDDDGGSGSSNAWCQVTYLVEGEEDSVSNVLLRSDLSDTCSSYQTFMTGFSEAYGVFNTTAEELEQQLSTGTVTQGQYNQQFCEAAKLLGETVVPIAGIYSIGRSFSSLTPGGGWETLVEGEYELGQVPVPGGEPDEPTEGRDVVGSFTGEWLEVVGASYLESWSDLSCDESSVMDEPDWNQGTDRWPLTAGTLALTASGASAFDVSLPDGVITSDATGETRDFVLSGSYPLCALTVEAIVSSGTVDGGGETDPPQPGS